MSRNYVITRTTLVPFARLVLPGVEFRNTSRPRLDGRLDLAVADDVADRLEQCRLVEQLIVLIVHLDT